MSTVSELIRLNHAYREGFPEVSDQDYDALHARLKSERPEHSFFQAPEPSPAPSARGRVQHIEPMLSTDKAYSSDEVALWVKSVIKAAGCPGDDIQVRITPKLDGVAAFLSGNLAYTRGDNGYGSDISSLFNDGMIIKLGIYGAGEIVVRRDYFDSVLALEYGMIHPRNFVAGLLGTDEFKPHHDRAIADRAVEFISYREMEGITLPISELESRWESLIEQVIAESPYLCDGAVVDVSQISLREKLGSNSHHHRWQLALKVNDQFVDTEVIGIRLTTGRTGRITPTYEVKPASLYGVKISWVTAHNHKMLKESGAGIGASIQITRGGGVIPALVKVHAPAPLTGLDLDHCPSCGSEIEMEGPIAFCKNKQSCPAQASSRLRHFFKTLGVCRGFGESTCDLLVAAGYKRPVDLYLAKDLINAGIGAGNTANLYAELSQSLQLPVGEEILMAAFGMEGLGRGDSRRLLRLVPIEDIHTLTFDQIQSVDGFAGITAANAVKQIAAFKDEIQETLALGFTLDRVNRAEAVSGPLSGHVVVFTGATSQPRKEMEKEAQKMGATVGGSVSSKTTLLVCGEKVGAAKTEKARKLGVKVITEADYLNLVSGGAA